MRLDLGPVTLDTDRHQVFRGAEPAHLSTKAFQLLELLVDNRPRALSKEELQKALWPDTFVSDTSLTTLVNEVRTLLSETAREPRHIRTVHGYGYAFEGPASPAPASGCRLVWDEREVLLDEGENILDATRRPAVPSLMRLSPAATLDHGSRRRRPRSKTSQSKNGTLVGENA